MCTPLSFSKDLNLYLDADLAFHYDFAKKLRENVDWLPPQWLLLDVAAGLLFHDRLGSQTQNARPHTPQFNTH